MRVYTKSGDKGKTGVVGGRISKNNPLTRAIGDVDECQATIGVLHSMKPKPEIKASLHRIQNDFFVIGAVLADPREKSLRTPKLSPKRTAELEKNIDDWEKKLPPLFNFILPGGTPFAAHAHLGRTICRRAERSLVKLHETSPLPPEVLVYINRLSDWLFTLARLENFEKHMPEAIWKP